MPYKCHQSVSPYYSSKLSNSSNSIHSNSIRKTNAASSPQQHQQEQNVKMSKAFSLSQSLSTSLPLFSIMASSDKGEGRLSETFFAQNDNENLQPLDLSMHPIRDEQTVKQPMTDQHKPICLVKSCTCSTQPGNVSPCHITEQGLTRSPLPGMTLSSCSRENLHLYSQHPILSSTYHTNSSKTTSPSAVPKILPWNSTEASPFQLLITSDKVLNGAHNSSGLYRPYDNHMHQDMNVSMCEDAEQESLATLSKQDNYVEENDEPTYMDLDSTTTALPTAKPNSYTGNSSFVYDKQNSPQMSFKHRNSAGSTLEAVCNPYQSPLLQALNSKKKNNDFSGQRSSPYFAGSVISHTSFEKNHKKIIGKTSIMQNSEKAAHPKHPQQQLPLPDSSTSPAIVPVSTGPVNLYRLHTDTQPTTTVQHQDTDGHTSMLHNNYPAYYKTSLSSQHLPSSTTQMHLMQSARKSPIDQESNAGSETETPTSNKITSSEMPVSTNTTSDRVSGNKHRRTGGCLDDSPPVTSEQEGNNSTKISLLDFWISKILMERSIETSQQKKPCNVDYICTANGEKRIRLRLVDLMEMQVEQSMKA